MYMASAEEQLARLRKSSAERTKRYRQRHKLRYFSVTLADERFDLLEKQLKKKNVSKKQFLENAIDKFLEE